MKPDPRPAVDILTLRAQVINLPHRTDRRAEFAAMAAEHGLRDYAFVPGVEHARPAEGISMAHRACVQRAKDDGRPAVWILEDDAHFTAPGALDLFRLRTLALPDDCGLFLGGVMGGDADDQGLVNWWSGLHCYVVRAFFYDHFLAVDPTKHLDHALWNSAGARVCLPYVCVQRKSHSDNVKRVVDYSGWGKDKHFTGA